MVGCQEETPLGPASQSRQGSGCQEDGSAEHAQAASAGPQVETPQFKLQAGGGVQADSRPSAAAIEHLLLERIELGETVTVDFAESLVSYAVEQWNQQINELKAGYVGMYVYLRTQFE